MADSRTGGRGGRLGPRKAGGHPALRGHTKIKNICVVYVRIMCNTVYFIFIYCDNIFSTDRDILTKLYSSMTGTFEPPRLK